MISTQTKIGIVGGGTTGLYLTILLKSRGFDVCLFERAQKRAKKQDVPKNFKQFNNTHLSY